MIEGLAQRAKHLFHPEQSQDPFNNRLPVPLNRKMKKMLASFYYNFQAEDLRIDERIEKMFFWIVDHDQENIVDMMRSLTKNTNTDNIVNWAKCQMVLSCMNKVQRQPIDESLPNSNFPKEFSFLNIADTWGVAEIKTVRLDEKGEGKEANFMIFDVNLADSWALKLKEMTDTEGIGVKTTRNLTSFTHFVSIFMETYFKHRSRIAKDVPMKIAIPISQDQMEAIPKMFINRLKKRPFQRYHPSEPVISPRTRPLALANPAEDWGQNIDTLNKLFLVDDHGQEKLFKNTKRFNFRFHGWTGSAESSVQPETLKQLAELGNNAVGIYPSGLGVKQSLKDKSELGGKKITTPKDYSDEILTLMDFLGVWNSELFLNGHSMGGVAMYYLADEIVKRMEAMHFKDIPKVHIIAENPALKDTCIFLKRGFDQGIQGVGNFAHATPLSEWLPGVVRLVTREYTRFLAPEVTARGVRSSHVNNYLVRGEDHEAIKREALGLKRQPDLPREMTKRINEAIENKLLSFIAIIGEEDNITSAKIQKKKFREYKLIHPVIDFLEPGHSGHFTHMEPLFTQIMSYLYRTYSKEGLQIDQESIMAGLRSYLTEEENKKIKILES
ncbi:MAG: alpha/beta hydrolase [Patescibacteria group bacterium]|jgi:pimeloyl-ACP methyl ester carboxylesterase